MSMVRGGGRRTDGSGTESGGGREGTRGQQDGGYVREKPELA